MARRMVPARAALLVIATAMAMSGCGGGTGGVPITRQDEATMRKPVGSEPMPVEAMRAMQQGTEAAKAKAGVPQGQPGQPGQPGVAPPPPPP